MQAIAGDPLEELAQSTAENKEFLMARLTAQLNLDVPPPARYFIWLKGLAGIFVGQPDFGLSRDGNVVLDVIAGAVPITLRLVTAATILAIDYLYELEMSRDEQHDFAASLGSDVPFMLTGGTAIGQGHGDQLTSALSRGTYHWVIAVSSSGLSTPAVYGECDRLRTGLDIKAPTLNDELLQSLLSGDSVRVGKSLNNDLQAAACSLRPALRLILDTGQEYGALGGIVSGSGPSVAFLVADEDHSLDLAVALTSSGVVGSVARAQGPVPGAKVISVD